MLTVLLLLTIAVVAFVAYGSYRFNDPTVPVVEDLFPPQAQAPYTLLEIWAHPDDETSCGGTTLKYGRHPQVRVAACYFTCGEAGKPGVPPMCAQEELALVRRGEMAIAATVAGMDTHVMADFGDGRLADRHFAELEEQAVRWIRRFQPTVIVTWDPSGSSGHRDHIRTHEVVRSAFWAAADRRKFPEHLREGLEPHQAARLYETVVPLRLVETFRKQAHQGNTAALDARTQPTHAVDVRAYVGARYRLVKAHRTQHKSLEPFSRWFGPLVYYCWRKEYFTLALEAEPAA